MHPYQDQGLVAREQDEGEVRLSGISICIFIVFVGDEYAFLLRLKMALGVQWWNTPELPRPGTWSRLGIERQKDGAAACMDLHLPAAEKGEKDVAAAP
jgi:hypothetical protein